MRVFISIIWLFFFSLCVNTHESAHDGNNIKTMNLITENHLIIRRRENCSMFIRVLLLRIFPAMNKLLKVSGI